MDLFEYMRDNFADDDSPLAKRMRPVKLEDVVGQEHIIGKDKLLYRAIKWTYKFQFAPPKSFTRY